MRNKFGAHKTEVDGIWFDSKAEAARYCTLKSQGTSFRRQVVYQFACGVKYIADFEYLHNGKLVVEDCKGMKTDVYIIKAKMMLHEYQIKISEVKIDNQKADLILGAYRGAAKRHSAETQPEHVERNETRINKKVKGGQGQA